MFCESSPAEPLAGTLGYAAVKRAAEALVRTYVQARGCVAARLPRQLNRAARRKGSRWLS